MQLENLDVRMEVIRQNVTFASIAKVLGISPQRISQLMSKPLSETWRRKILRVALLLANEREEQEHANDGR